MNEKIQTIVVGMLPDVGYEQSARVYSGGGISPTISARDYKGAIKVIVYERTEVHSDRNAAERN